MSATMMHLPAEVMEHVLSYLETETLARAVPKVCQKWADISAKIMEQRIGKMFQHFSTNTQQLEEIRTQLPPSEREDNQKILEIYEKYFLKKGAKIKSVLFANGRVADFVRSIHQTVKDCECEEVSHCIVRRLHWMPCHQLLLVQLPEKIDFYHMSALTNDEVGGRLALKYDTVLLGSTTANNVQIDNNSHTAVSVFHDKVVCQQTTRVLILFRVQEVSHDINRVTLENIRVIFLPSWSSDFILLEDKICILFTTGRVGIWRIKEDDIQLSENTCVDVETIRKMELSQMYSVKNLILVKIFENNTDHWSIFDSNDNQPKLQTLDLNPLITYNFVRGAYLCHYIYNLFVTTNVFIVHCEVIYCQSGRKIDIEGNYFDSGHAKYPGVFCRRLKKDPTLQDFLNSEMFDLIFDEDDGPQGLPTGCYSASLTSPILSLFIKESESSYDRISFVGVKDPIPDIQKSSVPSSSSKSILKKAMVASSHRKKYSPLSDNFGCTLYSLTNRNLQFISIFR